MASDELDLHAVYRSAGNAGAATARGALTKAGRAKNYRVDFQAEGLVVYMNAGQLNKTLGLALQEILAAQIKGIQQEASPASLRRRAQNYRAWQGVDKRERTKKGRRNFKNTAAVLRRDYTGGRIGETPPQDPRSPQWRKLFNVSGRLTRTTITPRKNSQDVATATINFPANRFDPRTTGDRAAKIISMAREHIPMLRGDVGAEYRGKWDQMLREHAALTVAKSLADIRRKRAALLRLKVAIIRQILRAAV